MVHACNPSYLRGRDQENHGSKPAWQKSSQDSISTKSSVWWCTTIIPTTRETQIRGSQSNQPGHKCETYRKCN
jgi:hypothetical protein